MKKIITLLFSVGAFAASFAQTGSHQTNGKGNNKYVTTKSNTNYKKFDHHRDNIYTFSAKEKDRQIAKINSDYDFKIKSIWSNHRINRTQKKMIIQKVQNEKAQKIQAVKAKFNSKYNTAFSEHIKQFDNHKH